MNTKKLISEFIGSFFLVIAVIMCSLGSNETISVLGIGAVLAAMAYAGGHISGAHYNPAVTIAVFLRGGLGVQQVPGYILSQLLGAVLAAIVSSSFLLGKVGSGMDLSAVAPQAILCEILGTFALVWVILNVATCEDTKGNSFYGLAIGMVILAMILSFGKISGAAFNPAVALGLAISNISGWANLWIYVVGELVGAVAACYIFLYVHSK